MQWTLSNKVMQPDRRFAATADRQSVSCMKEEMETGTIIAYIATFIALFFSITAFSQGIIGGLIGRFAGPLLGGLIGSIIAWLLIDWLWITFEGGHIPIVILMGALAFIFGHGFISKEELTEQSNWMMAAELWAIILIGVFLFIQSDVVRWY